KRLEYNNEMLIGGNYNWIGVIYHQQGKLDLAIDYIEKSLKIWEQFRIPNSNLFVGMGYNNLIKIFLDKQSPDQAQESLNRFSQFLENNEISRNFYWYRLAKARILKSSVRTRDRAEAEKILKTMIKGYDSLRESGTRGMPNEPTDALVELCSLYLEELYSTHDLGILNDIQPLLKRLLRESRRANSFSLLAHTNLLQGKISLLKMNIGDARQYLTQAQDIAEEHGLQLLARSISKEHDKLLEQLDKLENVDKLDMALAERLNFASLDDILERMQGKRAIEAPELMKEEPVLLLIITEGGVPVFSYPFADEWNQEDELFASFMSAITSFSSEFFSEGLDRVKFGHYTVLMKSMAELSSCYLFKGQTYLAKQKLTRFTEGIQTNTSIMETLNKYYQASQIIELKDFPFLEVFIKDVFG
ncbi:MAG: tetratricopeptide repeat protein, partial [Promethearchaeota archaeon]